jgi:predicted Fe-Mo cluster-binding NifX family protein
VLGILENMSGFVCPHCNQRSDIFAGQSGRDMAEDFHVPFLGSIPIDPAFGAACDSGKPFVTLDPDNPTAQAFHHAFEPLLETCEGKEVTDAKETKNASTNDKNGETMKVAIPLAGGRLSAHFGHCEQFAIVGVNSETQEITGQELLTPPAHEPGVLPQWLAEMDVNMIIAGGMGQRAQQLFAQNGIEVLCGAPEADPDQLVAQYLQGELALGENVCDH